MGKRFKSIEEGQREFIRRQKIYFVATAACDGRVNVSPKGMDTLRVLSANRVVWLNLTGSGNETAAHLLQNDRMTLMFCAFEGDPLILRLYGRARAVYPGEAAWDEWIREFPAMPGARQLMDMHVDLVQTSCGMGVPLFDFAGERDGLKRWAEKRGPQGIEEYWREHNRLSLDGRPTKVPGY